MVRVIVMVMVRVSVRVRVRVRVRVTGQVVRREAGACAVLREREHDAVELAWRCRG